MTSLPVDSRCAMNLASRSDAEDSNALEITCFAELISELMSTMRRDCITTERQSFHPKNRPEVLSPDGFCPRLNHAAPRSHPRSFRSLERRLDPPKYNDVHARRRELQHHPTKSTPSRSRPAK